MTREEIKRFILTALALSTSGPVQETTIWDALESRGVHYLVTSDVLEEMYQAKDIRCLDYGPQYNHYHYALPK